ncbi:MAG: hypothetical protein HYV07_00275 [Deltaproteobacteria bacterium]|nr:hypothetical protein [Deltaproteobacteria bacterium]
MTQAQYRGGLSSALREVESADGDADGFTNLEELDAGTFPGNAESHPPLTAGCPPRVRNPYYDVCFYDPRVVLRKIGLDFCGKSPSFEELELFAELNETDLPGAISAKLDECLDSEYWLGEDGALYRLAHRKIRPLEAIKSGSVRASTGFRIPLADYDDDYALFVYTQTDDRDARDLLTAKYYVRKTGATTYVAVQALLSQSLPEARRAGMLTTKWNLVYHIMFTPLPRTAAAQAYRAYLGLDIAKQDGLDPVDGEPVDYDAKGVTNPTCAICHSTLDPLSYPFSRYQGLTSFPFGTYESNRMDNFRGDAPRITETPESGVIFGTRVPNLVEWGRVAADSDAFARATVADYWTLLVGKPPSADETEFIQLWREFSTTHGYRVESMLHDLVRTEAYGAP